MNTKGDWLPSMWYWRPIVENPKRSTVFSNYTSNTVSNYLTHRQWRCIVEEQTYSKTIYVGIQNFLSEHSLTKRSIHRSWAVMTKLMRRRELLLKEQPCSTCVRTMTRLRSHSG